MANDLQLRVLLNVIDKALGPLKRITQGSGATAKSLKAAREQLKVLNATQADTSAWRTQRAALEQTSRAIDANQAKIASLARSMNAAGPPTRAMTRDYQRAIRESQRLKQQHDSQSQAVQALRGRLAAAGIDTRKFQEGERALSKQIAATNATISEQGRKLQELNRRQQAMAKARGNLDRAQRLAGGMAAGGAAALGVGYATSRPLNAAIQAFAPNEDAATQLNASMMQADGSVPAEFQKITDLATRLGDKLPGTTADFQNMMTMLRRQGLSAQSILGGTGEAAAYLGVQLQMPVESAAEFAAKMQDATGTTEKDMLSLMDTIQRTYYLGVDSGNMLQGFSKVAPAMAVLNKRGVEAADTFAPLLVMLDQAGMSGESAGNALRKVFQAGLNEKKVREASKMAGFTIDFTDGKGEFGGLEHLYGQLEKLQKLNSVDRTAVFSKIFGDDAETATALKTMMDNGLSGYQVVLAKMKNQADLRTRVDSQLKTLANTWEAAQGSWTNAMAEFGAAVAPELKELINWVGGLANKIGTWARENPRLAGGLVKVVAVISGLAFAGGALAVTLGGLVGPLAVIRYGMAILGVATNAALWPILAVIAAVAALAAAAYLIYANWDKVKAYFSGLWQEFQANANDGLGGIARNILDFSPLGLFYRAFASVMSYFGVELPGKFSEFGSMMLDGLISGITAKLGALKDAIGNMGDSTIAWFKEKLDIHSPSRVFAELGGFTTAGLALGITKGQSEPLGAISEMGKRLAAAGALVLGGAGSAVAIDNRPPISAASTAPTIMGDTYQITIQAPPGTETAGLRRMLEQLLDERERNKAARVRSILGDRE